MDPAANQRCACKKAWQKQLAGRALTSTGGWSERQRHGGGARGREGETEITPLSSCLPSSWFKVRIWGVESPSLHWASNGPLVHHRHSQAAGKSHEAFMKERLPRSQLGYQKEKKKANVNTHSVFPVLMFQNALHLEEDNIKERDELWKLGGGRVDQLRKQS